MTTKPRPRATTYTLVNERPHTECRPPKSGPGFVRPQNPAVYSTLRLQQRTSRSFETTAPPDILGGWLLDHNWRVVPVSNTPHEYGRFALGRTADEKPAALIILYWSGSVVIGGPASDEAARTLLALCEPTPATAGMFDSLDEGGAE